MKRLVKTNMFTLLDMDVASIKESSCCPEQCILKYVREKDLAEVEECIAKLKFPDDSEVSCWYDPEIQGTHYIQSIYEEV